MRQLARNSVALVGLLITVACSGTTSPGVPTATLQQGETLLITDASAYELREERAIRSVDFELTYRNPLDVAVAVPACHSPARPMLEKLVGGAWVHAFSPIEPMCITPPLVIRARGMYKFHYPLRADAYDLERWPGSADGKLGGTYRLRWPVGLHDRRSRTGVGRPLPEEYLVSDPFEVHAR